MTKTPLTLGSAADILIVNGVLITVGSDRAMIDDGCVAIKDGRIIAVGPSSRVRSTHPTAATVIDARGGVLVPGYVESHVHLSQHLGRSVLPDTWQENREHEHWLPYWSQITIEEARLSAVLACMEMIQNGSTCFSDMSGRFSAEVQAEAAELVGIRGIVAETIWDRPPHDSVSVGGTEQCLTRLEDLLDRFPKSNSSRVWAGVGLAGMGSASDELLTEAKSLARRRAAVMYMHQSFGVEDTAAARRQTGGRSAVEHLDDLGILGPDLHLVHMIHNSAPEIDLLARSGTSIVHCPAASLRWGMGVSRHGMIGHALRSGVNIALGSDSGNYSDFLDIGRQMYLAATIHREATSEVPTVRAEDALEMATINGAQALGVKDEIGSIEVGKYADLVIHSPRLAGWHPRYDPVRSLVYSAPSTSVDTVLVHGEVVYREGRFTRFDEAEMLAKIDEAAHALHERMGWRVTHNWPMQRPVSLE